MKSAFSLVLFQSNIIFTLAVNPLLLSLGDDLMLSPEDDDLLQSPGDDIDDLFTYNEDLFPVFESYEPEFESLLHGTTEEFSNNAFGQQLANINSIEMDTVNSDHVYNNLGPLDNDKYLEQSQNELDQRNSNKEYFNEETANSFKQPVDYISSEKDDYAAKSTLIEGDDDIITLETVRNQPNQHSSASNGVSPIKSAPSDLLQFLKKEFIVNSQKDLDQGVADMAKLKERLVFHVIENANAISKKSLDTVKTSFHNLFGIVEQYIMVNINALKILATAKAKSSGEFVQDLANMKKEYIVQHSSQNIAIPYYNSVSHIINQREGSRIPSGRAISEELQTILNDLEKEFSNRMIAFAKKVWAYMNTVSEELDNILKIQ